MYIIINIVFITILNCVGFIVSEIPRASLPGLNPYSDTLPYTYNTHTRTRTHTHTHAHTRRSY